MYYDIKRTATVTSADFSTMAKLSKESYNKLTLTMPDFNMTIENYALTYNDDSNKHITSMMKKIEYLRDGITPNILNHLVYKTPTRHYDVGQLIFKPGDIMNTIYMVEEGLVEIFFYLEGTRFILDRLPSGSLINYRNLFLNNEPACVYALCLKLSFIIELKESFLI